MFFFRATFSAIVCAAIVMTAMAAGQGGAADRVAVSRDQDEWTSYGLYASETRFSPLADIHAGNVGQLAPVWSFILGPGGGAQEATPLVHDGVIYTITTWSVVVAIDARTGLERWRSDPQVDRPVTRPAICCGVVNRGLALHGGMLIAPVIDGRIRALDAASGALIWESRVAFPEELYTITMAPRVAGDKVIIGVSGGERARRGFFDAYDVYTGHRAWRFYTVPGDPTQPFENEALRAAADTWDTDWWTRGGGGAVWDGMAYDPELGLVYVGTGNPTPWTYRLRSSRDKDNLYTASILAVDLQTGTLRWHYQVVPGDNWDYDAVQQLVLADIRHHGLRRKVLMQAGKNGFYYVIDRVTGQFLSAAPFVQVSWARGVHGRTGRPIVNEAAFYGTEAVRLSPGPGGAHNWAPMSFNPHTGLTYIPATTGSSFSYAALPDYEPFPGRSFGIVLPPPEALVRSPRAVGPRPVENENGGTGALVAWDPVRRRIRWRRPGGSSFGGGTVTTAGGLVFQTLGSGRLVAYGARRGELLLDLDTGLRSGIGPPITYRIDGRQYVALMGGTMAPRLVVFAVEPRLAVPRSAGEQPAVVPPRSPLPRTTVPRTRE